MLVQLIGVGKPMDFTTSDNKRIQGFKFFFGYEDDNVNGLRTDSKFISPDLSEKIKVTPEYLNSLVGEVIDIQVGINGKIIGINPAEGSIKG